MDAMVSGRKGTWRSETAIANKSNQPIHVVQAFLGVFGPGIEQRTLASGVVQHRLSRTTRNFLYAAAFAENAPFTTLLSWMVMPANLSDSLGSTR